MMQFAEAFGVDSWCRLSHVDKLKHSAIECMECVEINEFCLKRSNGVFVTKVKIGKLKSNIANTPRSRQATPRKKKTNNKDSPIVNKTRMVRDSLCTDQSSSFEMQPDSPPIFDSAIDQSPTRSPTPPVEQMQTADASAFLQEIQQDLSIFISEHEEVVKLTTLAHLRRLVTDVLEDFTVEEVLEVCKTIVVEPKIKKPTKRKLIADSSKPQADSCLQSGVAGLHEGNMSVQPWNQLTMHQHEEHGKSGAMNHKGIYEYDENFIIETLKAVADENGQLGDKMNSKWSELARKANLKSLKGAAHLNGTQVGLHVNTKIRFRCDILHFHFLFL